jgi:hypothetical protein
MGSIHLSLRRPDESDEDSVEVTPMAELLAGRGEQGGEAAPAVQPTLSNFLSSGPSGNREWVMQIQGPNGVEQWDWHKRENLPVRTTLLDANGNGTGGSGAGAAPTTSTTSPPAPAEGTTTEATPELTPGGETSPRGE